MSEGFRVPAGTSDSGNRRGKIYNPPDRDSLAYRVGTYPTLLRGLLGRLAMEPSSDGERRPLDRWNEDRSENWIYALLEAWAVTGDVLTFYTERIANEGFLRTAREDLSVRELGRALDHRAEPGTAAQVPLAFTVTQSMGLPTRIAVPRGTRVQSLPVRQEQQTFETLEDLDARVEWNALRPRVAASIPPLVLHGAATGIRLRGTPPGLEPGTALLLLGRDADGRPRRFFRFLETAGIQALPAGGLQTLLAWRDALDPDRPADAVLASEIEIHVLRRRSFLFGHDAPAWSELPPEVARGFAPLAGGVLLTADAGRAWSPVNDGLPAKPVRALAAGVDGALYAAGAAGLFRSLDGGASWEGLPPGPHADAQALIVDPRGTVWTGTADGGVFRSYDRGVVWESAGGGALGVRRRGFKAVPTQLPRAPVRCLLAEVGASALTVWAGTNQGVFRSADAGNGWEPVNSGLPGFSKDSGWADLPVLALATAAGLHFAATAQGVFRSADRGNTWSAASRGLPGASEETGLSDKPVRALAVSIQARTGTTSVFAATEQGVYRSTDLGRSWRPANRGLPGTDPRTGASTTPVTCLAALEDSRTLASYLFAGGPRGLFVSGDLGETWARSGGKPTEEPIAALAVSGGGAGSSGTVLAATPPGGLSGNEWPGFRISGSRIDIDPSDTTILPGGWAVLQQSRDGEGPLEGIYPVTAVRTLRRDDFTLERQVTRLDLDTTEDLGVFDLRTVTAFARSERLDPVVEEEVVFDRLDPRRFLLDHRLENPFPSRRPVIVTGKPVRARFTAGDQGAWTVLPDDPKAAPMSLGPDEELQILEPLPAGEAGDPVELRVRHPGSGLTGRITVPRGSIVWRPALDGDASVVEARQAETAPADAGRSTEVILDTPLRSLLDPRTVTLAANVAVASQGGTVPREVLGSGDASRASQRFTLRQTLTWLRAGDGATTVPALEIWVNDVLWREVPSLFEAGPRDAVYMVRTDERGLPTVIFGDGVRGARLPTGQENVAAVYRSGLWTEGVDAGHITLLQTRPFGLQDVINPLPAPPGTPPETRDEMRERIPLAVRTLGRIVSLSDYEDFARTFPGVARARCAPLHAGGARVVHLTLAPVGGRVLGEDDPLLTDLARAIDRVRDAPLPVRLSGWRRVRFDVAARVLVDRRYQAAAVEAAARAALARAYTFARSRFGQTVTAGEVTALLEGVDGVVASQLTAFHPSGESPRLEPRLRAGRARVENGEIVPDELLVLNDPEGIALAVEPEP